MNETRINDLTHLEDRYFERMASSLGDKARIVDYLPPVTETHQPHVADIGAGGGEFASVLVNLGYKVTAVDVSKKALRLIEEKNPEISTIEALANRLNEHTVEKFDAIVCSSVLHEVYSYGDDIHKSGHLSSLGRAIDSFKETLNSGGVLIIRDGVKPDGWFKSGEMHVKNEDVNKAVLEYLKLCPFANGDSYDETGHIINLEQVEPYVWAGNFQSLMEFAYTYTWGVESFPREALELYGVMTLKEYEEFLTNHGFQVTNSFTYTQKGYEEHLKNSLVFSSQGESLGWFPTNAIWVGKKVS